MSQEQKEDALRDHADLFGILRWDLMGGVIDADDVFLRMVGYTRDDLSAQRMNWFAMTPPEWRAADAEGMVQVRETGAHPFFEKEFIHKNGSRVSVVIRSALNPGSDRTGVSYVLDVSGRKAAEAAARAAERRVAGVLEGMSDAFVALDADWRITYLNAEAERIAGRHRNEIIGRSHWEVWPATVGTRVEREYHRVAAERVASQFEHRYEDGALTLWLEIRAYPEESAGGGVNVFYRDITKRKQAEEAVRRAQQQLRFITDAAPLLISYVDADLCYRFVNQRYADWFGRPIGEIVGQHVEEIIGVAALQKVRPKLELALSGQSVEYETQMPYAQGGHRYVRTFLVPDTAAGEEKGATTVVRGFVSVVADITVRRQAEERQRFLAGLVERTRFLSDPEAVSWETVGSVGEFLALSRYLYADIDPLAGTVTVHRDFCRGEHVQSVAGTWPLAPWGKVVEELAAGRTIVNCDYASDPRTAGDYEAIYQETGIRANVTVPLFRDGRWVAVFSAQMIDKRPWTDDEVALLEAAAERSWLTIENARLLRAQTEAASRQRRFIREMLFSLTEGRLRLCDAPADLPAPLPEGCDPVDLTARTLRRLRRDAAGAADELQFSSERTHDLVSAVGEAAMNAVVHAGGGEGQVRQDKERGVIQVWIQDQGAGIQDDAIHRATLERGFSSAGTLGHGFWVMLQTCDQVYLLTGPGGTTVVLEQERTLPPPAWMPRDAAGQTAASKA